MTVADLQIKRDALISEIAKANQRLESGAGAITKRSIDELQKSLAIIDNEIQRASFGARSAIGRLYSNEGL